MPEQYSVKVSDDLHKKVEETLKNTRLPNRTALIKVALAYLHDTEDSVDVWRYFREVIGNERNNAD